MENMLRPEEAEAALEKIGLACGVDENGQPAFDWMGLRLRLHTRPDGKNVVVVELGDGTLRVVQGLGDPAIVEVCTAVDAVGSKVWTKAVITPDWRGDGQIILRGWKEIADACGVTEETAREWANKGAYRMPVRFMIRGKKRFPMIPLLLLQAWIRDTSFSGNEANIPAKKMSLRRPRLRLAQR